MKTLFPTVIDSSLMAAFKSCPRKAQLEYFEHWKSLEPSVHLHAGAAFAAGCEATRVAYYASGKSPDEALAEGLHALLTHYGDFDCPEDSPKSASRMAGALEYFFYAFPLGTDKAIPLSFPNGKRGIEFSFLEPLDLSHPETGEPLLYAGRMDMCVDYEGMKLGEDDKTTSQLGASWPRQWDLRSQFTSYCWGAARAGIKLDGFLVRGVSILKSRYDHAQAITYRPQWQIDRWYVQLQYDVARMVKAWKIGYFDFNLDHACVEYGGCPFRSVCQMREPSQLLETRFERRIWDPVTRTETKID